MKYTIQDLIDEMYWYKEQAKALQSKYVVSWFNLKYMLNKVKNGKMTINQAMQKMTDYERMLI